MTLPPGNSVFSAPSDMLQLFRNIYAFTDKQVQRHGPIFRTRIFDKQVVILASAEGQEFTLVSGKDKLSNREGYKQYLPFFGRSLNFIDGDLHSQQRGLVTPAFHAGALKTYLDSINRITEAHLANWETSGTLSFYQDMKALLFTISSSILFGIEQGSDRDYLLEQWELFNLGNFGIIRLKNRLTAFGRGMHAKDLLDQRMLEQISSKDTATDTTLMRLLANIRDEDGQPIPQDLLLDHLRLIAFAGFDTATGTINWLMIELLQHPELLERIRAEVHADDTNAPVTLEDVGKKPLLDAAIQETLRMYPQTPLLMRGVTEPITFGDFTIPAGWSLALIPPYTQRRSDYFSDPNTFDPERFLAPREEGRKTPYAWIGFGAGPHACIGEGIAKMEMKAIITALLRRFDIQLVPGQTYQQGYIPLNHPRSEVNVTYNARKVAVKVGN